MDVVDSAEDVAAAVEEETAEVAVEGAGASPRAAVTAEDVEEDAVEHVEEDVSTTPRLVD